MYENNHDQYTHGRMSCLKSDDIVTRLFVSFEVTIIIYDYHLVTSIAPDISPH